MSPSSFSKFKLDSVAIVGWGSIGKFHAQVIRKRYPNTNIRVFSRSADEGDIHHYCKGELYNCIDSLVASKPSIAFVCNATVAHVETAMKFAKAGVHLFVEKPLSSSYEDAEKLVRYCDSHSIFLAVGYVLRSHPSLQFFKSLIAKEAYGRLYRVSASVGQHLASWREGSDYRKSVSANRLLGGGVTLELSHEIDYLNWIFGSFTTLFGRADKISDLDIDAEDFLQIVGVLDGPKYKSNPVNLSVEMDFFRCDSVRECIAYFSCGTLKWDALSGKVSLWKLDDKRWRDLFVSDLTKTELFTFQLENLEDFLSGRAESPIASGGDALSTLRILSSAKLL